VPACPRRRLRGQFTANTMGMVSEALGLAPDRLLDGAGVFSERAPLMRRARST
jgi:dihydroxy-acid dehydratase